MENNDKMDNLIMLLDDYEERIVGVHSVGDKINDKETAWIISKKFGFIQWLVDNDKINGKKVFHFLDTSELYEDVLCNLALSDTPIEDLVSILK